MQTTSERSETIERYSGGEALVVDHPEKSLESSNLATIQELSSKYHTMRSRSPF